MTAKANVDSRSNDCGIALMNAAYLGDVAYVRLLVDAKANIASKSKDGNTVFTYAKKQGHHETAAMQR